MLTSGKELQMNASAPAFKSQDYGDKNAKKDKDKSKEKDKEAELALIGRGGKHNQLVPSVPFPE